MKSNLTMWALTALLVVSVAGVAHAQSPAITSFSGGTEFVIFYGGSTGDVVGYRFTVSSPLTVDSLGAWNADTTTPLTSEDNPGAGTTTQNPVLDSSHQVGIWDDTQTLLASVTVTPTSPTNGDWRYESITPITLNPGTTYTAGMLYTATDGDGYVSGPTSVVTDPDITVLNGVFPSVGDLGFVFPTEDSAGNNGRYGPNFTVMMVPVELTEFSIDDE